MHNPRLLLLIVVVLGLNAEVAFSQPVDSVSTTQPEASPFALYEAAITALGGEAFLQLRSQATRAYGAITPPGMTQEMRFESMLTYELLPHKNRVEITLSSGTIVQAFNGDFGWLFIGGRLVDISEEQREQSRYGTSLLRAFDPTRHTLASVPDEEVKGHTTHGFSITDNEGYTTAFFTDTNTHRLLKIAYTLQGVPREEYFSAYQEVDGLHIPFQVEVFQDGQQVMRATLEEVTINPSLDPALFEIPQH